MEVVSGPLPSLSLKPRCFTSLDSALSSEWIVTNGLGGYASSTALCVNTRKYHGLLVAALQPPRRRTLFLAKIDEELTSGSQTFMLGTNEFRDVFHPEGYKYLTSFSLNQVPSYTYKIDAITIDKTIYLIFGKNASVIDYSIKNPTSNVVKLRFHPFISYRQIYSTADKDDLSWSFKVNAEDHSILIKTSEDKPSLLVSPTEGIYHPIDEWFEDVFFRVDASRGESCLDDYYQPGFFEVEIGPQGLRRVGFLSIAGKTESEVYDVFRSIKWSVEDLASLRSNEISRLNHVIKRFQERYKKVVLNDPLRWLLLAADSFLVKGGGDSRSIIAGYHWFGEWGRDTMISLPGLALVTGLFDVAKDILNTYGSLIRDGLIPNTFPDQDILKPEYGSIDSSLWYVNAVYQYLKYTGDINHIEERLLGFLESIIDRFIEGKVSGVKYDQGLLLHGPGMTWMDARVGGNPVTPRAGEAVEIEALWYNALRILEAINEGCNRNDRADYYGSKAEAAKREFLRKFWDQKSESLFDVVEESWKDPSLRPNQILAISLDFGMLDDAKSKMVVFKVWNKLWGTFGLRSLSEDDPRYIGTYTGDWEHRDKAYHNGPIWAWLTGPFVTAFLKVKRYKKRWRKFAYENFLEPLFTEEIYRTGLGTVGEIFDGEWPNRSVGCISQAWSVAELIRVYFEDVLYRRPPFEKEMRGYAEGA